MNTEVHYAPYKVVYRVYTCEQTQNHDHRLGVSINYAVLTCKFTLNSAPVYWGWGNGQKANKFLPDVVKYRFGTVMKFQAGSF